MAITREQIAECIEAERWSWDRMSRHERTDFLRAYGETMVLKASNTSQMVGAWESHCAEVGHMPCSQGGEATYAGSMHSTAAICKTGDCDWYWSL